MQQSTSGLLEYFLFIEDIFNPSDDHETGFVSINWEEQQVNTKGVRKGFLGVNPPPWAWYFTKYLLPAQRKLNVFAYFLLVNLSS